MKVGTRVRALNDGQLGHLVETESGGIGVRLDRRADTRVLPFHPGDWTVDKETRLQPMQVARVAYEADKALRLVLGEYGLPEWVSMPEPARIAWLQGLPDKSSGIRSQLYRAILLVLVK